MDAGGGGKPGICPWIFLEQINTKKEEINPIFIQTF
jgi:hypothetical protein